MNHLLVFWDMSWTTNEIFYFNRIEAGIEIFSDKKNQVTFSFEYIIKAMYYFIFR